MQERLMDSQKFVSLSRQLAEAYKLIGWKTLYMFACVKVEKK